MLSARRWARAGTERGKCGGAEREADGWRSARQFSPAGVNDELSGGEKKRMETLQLAMFRLSIARARRAGLGPRRRRAARPRPAGRRVTTRTGLGVLAITHYGRLLRSCEPDRVHVLVAGRVVASGGPELADQLERDRLRGPRRPVRRRGAAGRQPRAPDDPFADPGF